jgi:hypothetical protein
MRNLLLASVVVAMCSASASGQYQTMEAVVALPSNNCPITLIKSNYPIDRYSGKTPYPFQSIDRTVRKCVAATLAPVPQSSTMIRLNIAIEVNGGAEKAMYEASGTLGNAITVDFVRGDPLIQWPASITLQPGFVASEPF